jgi:hypothetical protein
MSLYQELLDLRTKAIGQIQDIYSELRKYYKNTDKVFFDDREDDIVLRFRELGLDVDMHFKFNSEHINVNNISSSYVYAGINSRYKYHEFSTASLCGLADVLLQHKTDIRKNKIKDVLEDK